MSDECAPVPVANGTVRRLFDDPEFRIAKRGYHPADVTEFMDDFGARMINLIERLQTAEAEAEASQAELDDFRQRVEQAESSRELFDRTLALAEETANAAVSDAKSRAVRLQAEAQKDARRMVDETRLRIERMMDAARADVQQAYADERRAITEAEARIQDEGDQLETLRLAVAAETMALEEVRNELRRRIRRAATDLLGVAESPDCLGTPVTRGIPEVVAREVEQQVDQEASVPEIDDEPVAAAIAPSTAAVVDPAPSPQLETSPEAVEPPPAPEPSELPEIRVEKPMRAIDLVEPHGSAVTVVPEDEPVEDVEAEPAAADADAFDRFMSDEIEDEPSRSWILA